MPKVAISADFLTAYSQIPKAQQKKVREFAEKFQYDPKQSSINYEAVRSAIDSKVRTVRIGVDYRAVVIHPSMDDVYLLVWVDHHDEAMNWAKNKLFDVNKRTGSLQIIDTAIIQSRSVGDVDPLGYNKSESALPMGLFDNFTDEELISIGMPNILLAAIRSLKTEQDLDAIQPYIPPELYECLLMLAAGYNIEEVTEESQKTLPKQAGYENDFAKALEHPSSRRMFKIVRSRDELTEMLDQPLEKWRVFLHPNQNNLVRGIFRGPVCVRGGAGTGKTVVAMHRAKHLVENIFNSKNDLVLLTTFTKNLAQSIANNMEKLCSASTLKQIEIVNLHSWAISFLRSNGVEVNIADNNQQTECWKQAITSVGGEFVLNFYREEWEQVILAQEITELSTYLRASRIGRGTRLTRSQRVLVWKVFEVYREKLSNKGLSEWNDIIRQARGFIENNQVKLPYRCVIVDESQDLHPEEFKLIRSLVKEQDNDIFIVGDAHQRIYARKTVLGHCGINVRGARSKKLIINYRTTEEIRQWAVKLLEGEIIDDLDGGIDKQNEYKSLLHGEKPIIESFETIDDEIRYITTYINLIRSAGVPLQNICIVIRTGNLIDRKYLPALESRRIPCVSLSARETDTGDGVRLATMHRVKGLEFQVVIIAGANDGIIPLSNSLLDSADEVSRKELLLREKSLLYVAATRAREQLIITSYGKMSPLIANN